MTEALDRIVEKRKTSKCVPISCGREVHLLDLYQVLYAEVKNHSVEIHLKSDKTLKTGTSLTEIKNLFDGIRGFAQISP